MTIVQNFWCEIMYTCADAPRRCMFDETIELHCSETAIMNARTSYPMRRYFTALFVALISFGLASTAMAADELVRFLPDNTKGVISMDVDNLRKSGALDKLMKSTGASKQLDAVNAQLSSVGFEPLTQIDRALLQVPSFDRKTEPLLIFKGRFPQAAIEEALKEEAHATRKTIGDIVVFTRGTRGSLAFLAPNIAAIGPTSAVEAAANIAANKAKSRPSSVIRSAISQANSARNIWFAVDLPKEHLAKTPFKGARVMYGDANITADLLLNVYARMPSTDAADASLKNAQSMLKDIAERDEITAIGLAPVVQAVRVTQKGDTVQGTLTVDQSRFRRLLITVTTIIRDQLQ